MNDLRAAIHKLVARWDREVALTRPQVASQVRRLLQTVVPAVPEDLVVLYCETGGMKDCEMDKNLFSLWPLDKVIAEAQLAPGNRVEFGDFLIDCHRYSLAFTEGRSEVWINAYSGNPNDDHRIFDSLTDFFVKYAAATSEDAAFRVLHGLEEQV
ncbi:MAG: hypothetical protein JNL18_21700 [Planctomycetaceae bacterium]|nr:hypothetical protein [Planctomycetaceae bacterium]